MARLIQLQQAQDVVAPPSSQFQVYANIFYTQEAGKILKKAKLADGSVITISQE